jgi:hypothetical protein
LTFVLGVSSGLFSAAAEGERLQYSSLYSKATYCITKGVQFVQLDLESVSEFKYPDLKKEMENLKKLGITFGIHSETRAFGVEIAEMDSAIETDYKFGHERLKEILERAGEIGSKYVLIHSSESEPFLMLERHMQPALLVDYFGNSFRDFLNQYRNLVEWLVGGNIEEVSEKIFNFWEEKKPQEKRQITEKEIKQFFKSDSDFIWRELLHGFGLADYIRRIIIDNMAHREINLGKNYENMSEEQQTELNNIIKGVIKNELNEIVTRLLDFIQSRSLSYGPERIAYYIVAKHMEITNDPLWTNIIENTLKYFAKVENKTKEQWLNDKGIKKNTIEDENFRLHSYIWVPAVSAKYIWGHLNPEKNYNTENKKKYPDIKPVLKKYNMPLVLETPMAHRGIEEWLRLPNPIQMYYLAKEVNKTAGFECLALAIDLEHMLSIRLDPEKVFDSFPEDAGKFVRVIHAGFPAALAPAHIPIPLGSEQQVYLYKMYYKLWKKGFGKDTTEYYLVFERGGGADPIQQSILALRKIVDFLEKDINPDDLIKHPEFFGISIGEIASMERQWAAIHEHGRDPLKGLIVVPEEEYTFLGKAAAEKGKAELWKKEELR